MSDLYKEALLDGRKLRQVAEEEAKKKLLETFTPYVKEMISKEFKEKSLFEDFQELKEKSFVVGEQEEAPPVGDPLAPAATSPAPDPTVVPPAPGPTDTVPPTDLSSTQAPPVPVDVPPMANPASASPESSSLPVEPVGQDLGGTTLDSLGDDGKITVDVNDLFSPSAPEAIAQADEVMTGIDDLEGGSGPEDLGPPSDTTLPADELSAAGDVEAGAEAPVASEEEMAAQQNTTVVETVEKIVSTINEMAYKIDLLTLKEQRVNDLEKNYHKTRLFSLLEQVDNLKEKGLITGRQATILENKLEFLFIKLKEANFTNSYMKTIGNNSREENDTMAKSLKSIAAQLFLEESDAMERTQISADSRVKSNGSHAANVSGNPKGHKADSENSVPTKEKEVAWDEQDPDGKGVLEETYEAGDETVDASSGFGDEGSEEPEVEFEVSEAELMEAIKQLRKENVQRKVKAIKESKEELDEQCDDEEEETLEEQAEFGEEDDSSSFGSDDSALGGGHDDLDAPAAAAGGVDVDAAEQDLQAAFDALGLTDVSVSLGGASDDDDIEIVDDEGGLGSDEEDVMLHDDEAGVEEGLAAEMALYEAAKKKLLDKKKKLMKEAAAKKAATSTEKKRLLEMRRELNENNLFTTKTVFLNKILMRENMSKETTRKVVQLLDKARTLSEAKEIYQKILVRLQESKVAAQAKSSGLSKQLTATAAKQKAPATTINESKQPSAQPQTLQEGVYEVDRWKLLAGIK